MQITATQSYPTYPTYPTAASTPAPSEQATQDDTLAEDLTDEEAQLAEDVAHEATRKPIPPSPELTALEDAARSNRTEPTPMVKPKPPDGSRALTKGKALSPFDINLDMVSEMQKWLPKILDEQGLPKGAHVDVATTDMLSFLAHLQATGKASVNVVDNLASYQDRSKYGQPFDPLGVGAPMMTLSHRVLSLSKNGLTSLMNNLENIAIFTLNHAERVAWALPQALNAPTGANAFTPENMARWRGRLQRVIDRLGAPSEGTLTLHGALQLAKASRISADEDSTHVQKWLSRAAMFNALMDLMEGAAGLIKRGVAYVSPALAGAIGQVGKFAASAGAFIGNGAFMAEVVSEGVNLVTKPDASAMELGTGSTMIGIGATGLGTLGVSAGAILAAKLGAPVSTQGLRTLNVLMSTANSAAALGGLLAWGLSHMDTLSEYAASGMYSVLNTGEHSWKELNEGNAFGNYSGYVPPSKITDPTRPDRIQTQLDEPGYRPINRVGLADRPEIAAGWVVEGARFVPPQRNAEDAHYYGSPQEWAYMYAYATPKKNAQGEVLGNVRTYPFPNGDRAEFKAYIPQRSGSYDWSGYHVDWYDSKGELVGDNWFYGYTGYGQQNLHDDPMYFEDFADHPWEYGWAPWHAGGSTIQRTIYHPPLPERSSRKSTSQVIMSNEHTFTGIMLNGEFVPRYVSAEDLVAEQENFSDAHALSQLFHYGVQDETLGTDARVVKLIDGSRIEMMAAEPDYGGHDKRYGYQQFHAIVINHAGVVLRDYWIYGKTRDWTYGGSPSRWYDLADLPGDEVTWSWVAGGGDLEQRKTPPHRRELR